MEEKKLIIKGLEIGQTTTGAMLLELLNARKTTSGNDFVILKLSDGDHSIDAKMWDTKKSNLENDGFAPGVVVTVTLKRDGDYNGKPSYIVSRMEPSVFPPSEFTVRAPLPPEEMYSKIMSIVCPNPSEPDADEKVGSIVRILYEKYKDQLLTSGAAKGFHHNYLGGLLYHTYRMVLSAKTLADVYTSLDRDLLLSATALHDIGKLRELHTDATGRSTYTPEGHLLGHINIGSEMISEAARETHCDPEKVTLLKHCILAHHGQLEFGSPKIPSIPEASMLFCLDLMDSRMEMFEQSFKDTEPGTVSSQFVKPLNTYPYRPSHSELRAPVIPDSEIITDIFSGARQNADYYQTDEGGIPDESYGYNPDPNSCPF